MWASQYANLMAEVVRICMINLLTTTQCGFQSRESSIPTVILCYPSDFDRPTLLGHPKTIAATSKLGTLELEP
jgi:hypothetical protein